MEQIEIRAALVEALRADLVGPMARDEVLENRPSRWYLTGFLVPNDTPMEERRDPGVAEELSIDADAGDEADDEVQGHQAFLPSSMGLSFLVGPDTRKLEVDARWADYRELDDQTTMAWRDRERERRGLPPRPDREDDGRSDKPPFRYWKRTADQAPGVTVHLDRGAERVALTQERDVYLEVVVRPAPEDQGRPGTRVVSLFLVNGREPRRTAAEERYLFQTELEVRCREGFVPRVARSTSDHPDDRRNDLQFRHHAEWAVGHGVATRTVDLRDGRCTRLATTWLPTGRVHRMRARSIAGVTLGMDALADLDDPAALRTGMGALLSAYTDWIATQATRAAALDIERHRDTGAELVDEARLALARMQDGLALLAEDPEAFRAFRLMNRAMADTARRQRPDDETPAWRLFQLAFVLLNLRGSTDPDHADRQRVELLFFPTGGGKTEAYLGVAAYTLFLRRLRHRDTPHQGAGVSVLLRYTLRLLTLDQLQRAAQLTCAMEVLRREDPDALGAHRFSIGVWVGRKATANRFKDVKPVIGKLRRGAPLFGEPAPLPLEGCPWCGTDFDQWAYTLVPEGRDPAALRVCCANEDCPFSAIQTEDMPETRQGLPIVAVDEHLYRELPCIVIGTVDKFASLPWRGASGNLFGRVRAVDAERGFFGADESPPRAAESVSDGLPPPDLIIQDELHLISGPLGTMVGLYETAIDALCRDKQPAGPKIIASTATARRATEQIQAVFGRPRVHLFPPQGIDDGDTFFAETDTSEQTTRLYVGVASPGRAMKALSARVYACLLGAAQRRWEEAGRPGLDNPGDTYMTLVAYFNALKELGGAQRIMLEEVNGRTRQLSQRRPLDDDESEHFADRIISYDILELTSRQSTEDIAKASALLRKAYTPRGKTRTDVLLASSMISVGVDIPRLGLMVVNGQPRTCAEYIQASSRVGRKTPGLVVTAYNLFKPRDRSHYERFEAFHASFYRYVEAASVTPFSARAVDRGLAGLVVGLARHLPPRMAAPTAAERVAGNEGLPGRLADLLVARAVAHRPDFPAAMEERLRERVTRVLDQWEEVVELIHDAGQQLIYSPWEGAKGQSLLRTAVDDVSFESADLVALLDQFRAPTSMRDVEPSVHIWVDKPQIRGR